MRRMPATVRRPEDILAARPLWRIVDAKPKALWGVAPSDSVLVALRVMAERNIGFVLVLERGTLVGVLSERDCGRLAARAPAVLDTTPVADIMIRNIITVTPEHSFAECLRLMHEHGIRHLPVVDGVTPIAVVSIRDLLGEAVAHHARIIHALELERLTILTCAL
jgi:predicted transcriptional regulator